MISRAARDNVLALDAGMQAIGNGDSKRITAKIHSVVLSHLLEQKLQYTRKYQGLVYACKAPLHFPLS